VNAKANAVRVRHAFNALHAGTEGLAAFPTFLQEIIEKHSWEIVARPDPTADPDKFATIGDWLVAPPPTGLGAESREQIKRLVAKTDAEIPLRKALKNKPGPNSRTNRTRTTTGERRAYTLERLWRERPDLAARVEANGLSPNAAAIEAGFRAKAFTIRTNNPATIAATLRRQLKPDILRDVAKLIAND
jgi:hypothetical protein